MFQSIRKKETIYVNKMVRIEKAQGIETNGILFSSKQHNLVSGPCQTRNSEEFVKCLENLLMKKNVVYIYKII